MNSMKRQKGMTLKDKSPQVSNMLLEKSGEIASEKNEDGWAKVETAPSCG